VSIVSIRVIEVVATAGTARPSQRSEYFFEPIPSAPRTRRRRRYARCRRSRRRTSGYRRRGRRRCAGSRRRFDGGNGAARVVGVDARTVFWHRRAMLSFTDGPVSAGRTVSEAAGLIRRRQRVETDIGQRQSRRVAVVEAERRLATWLEGSRRRRRPTGRRRAQQQRASGVRWRRWRCRRHRRRCGRCLDALMSRRPHWRRSQLTTVTRRCRVGCPSGSGRQSERWGRRRRRRRFHPASLGQQAGHVVDDASGDRRSPDVVTPEASATITLANEAVANAADSASHVVAAAAAAAAGTARKQRSSGQILRVRRHDDLRVRLLGADVKTSPVGHRSVRQLICEIGSLKPSQSAPIDSSDRVVFEPDQQQDRHQRRKERRTTSPTPECIFSGTQTRTVHRGDGRT
jgi:hypothetical protein